MAIDWNAFTPTTSFAGGVLIGIAAGVLILLSGRIAGISGILGGLLRPRRADLAWRLVFIGGLLVSPWVFAELASMPTIRIDTGYPVLLAAGFLVGIGTRYGSGCTSGHGVCGLSRLSRRSLVATAVFMAAAFLTNQWMRMGHWL